MNSTQRLIIALTISSLFLFHWSASAASLNVADFVSLAGLEQQMKQQYDKWWRGYIRDAKQQIEMLKRLWGIDPKTKQIILHMTRYIATLEWQDQSAVISSPEAPAMTISTETLSTLPRRYRKTTTPAEKWWWIILSDEQFNSSSAVLAQQLSAKTANANKNNATVIKKSRKILPYVEPLATVLPTKNIQKSATATPTPIVTTAVKAATAPVVSPATKPLASTSKTPSTPTAPSVPSTPSTPSTPKPVQKASATTVQASAPSSVRLDEQRLRQVWMSRVNEIRDARWLPAYIHTPRLDVTARERSIAMSHKQMADHKRTSTSPYYSYKELETWFSQRWVVFGLIGNSTFTENVGRTFLDCSSTGMGDCTDQAIKNMRSIFDYFAAEEHKSYRPHRETMVHPTFSVVGVGFYYSPEQKRLYMTAHHGNSLE